MIRPIGPGLLKKKTKVNSGTTGKYSGLSGIDNLEVLSKIKKALEHCLSGSNDT